MSENNFLEITSLQNETVKEVTKLQIKKYRKEQKLIVLEGEKSVFGALDEGIKLKQVFVLNVDTIPKKTEADVYFVNEKVMSKISSTKSPCAILAVAFEPKNDLSDFFKMKKIVLIDNVKDAGNLGTIIRSAAAFAIEGILLYGDCVDEYSPKVIRSSAGNIFKIPIANLGIDTSMVKNLKKTHKIITTVAPANCENDASKEDYSCSFVLLLGSEASGLCNELLTLGDVDVTLKMNNDVESLNLAVFSGIMFYLINAKN